MITIENFFSHPGIERGMALDAHYEKIRGFDGFSLAEASEWEWDKLDMQPGLSAYRRYLSEYDYPTLVHHDADMGKKTEIVFLYDNPDHGLAFWEPKVEKPDSFDLSHWRMTDFVVCKLNKAVVFDSKLWHSRYPARVEPETTYRTARTIKIFFGT